eukprot:gb/GECG01010149.1/.p1 GENE.gb/GECG01010149.1/~~gb/GECG01010149.1/.p1  ORF type:complete len:538 (+),score=59.02 gb/GECG01010149.1/:1-1614(+)
MDVRMLKEREKTRSRAGGWLPRKTTPKGDDSVPSHTQNGLSRDHGLSLLRIGLRPRQKLEDQGFLVLSLATIGLTLLTVNMYLNFPSALSSRNGNGGPGAGSWIFSKEWLPKPGAFSRTIAGFIGMHRRQYDGELARFDGKREMMDWSGCAEVGDPEDHVVGAFYRRQQRTTLTVNTIRHNQTQKQADERHLKLPRKTQGNARILITGAASFVGFHTIEAMNEKQRRRLIAVDDFRDSPNLDDEARMKRYRAVLLEQRASVSIKQIDICSAEELEALLREKVSHVLHFHEPIDPPKTGREELKYELDRRLECHKRLLSTIRKVTADMPFSIPVIYLSTGGTARVSDRQRILSDDATRFRMISEHKASLERLSQQYYHDYHIPSLALRVYSIFGPLCSSLSPFRRLGEALLYTGTVSPVISFHSLDFLYVRDFARAVVDVLWIFDTKNPISVFSGLSVDMAAGNLFEQEDLVELLRSGTGAVGRLTLKVSILVGHDRTSSVNAYQKGLGAHLKLSDNRAQIRHFAGWLREFLFAGDIS